MSFKVARSMASVVEHLPSWVNNNVHQDNVLPDILTAHLLLTWSGKDGHGELHRLCFEMVMMTVALWIIQGACGYLKSLRCHYD